MKNIIALVFVMLISIPVWSQVKVEGVVRDAATGSALRGASVMAKNGAGKILKFATTKAAGEFTLQMDSIRGCRLEVSMMNYAKQTLALDSVALPIEVDMEPKTTVLNEVMVKADKIREQGDTITYRVGAFAQKQDRSIGDVLARMPGMKVDKSGQIQYQGEDINKFYIEGSDLLGGKYGIATNGISHTDVGAVEVMENHQPMQVLSGISFSDKAAINLKLKNKAKATWSLHGTLGGGYDFNTHSGLWNGGFFAMAAMPKFQNITTLKSNNTGENIKDMAYDFFNTGRGTSLQPSIQLSIPGAAGLDGRRTRLNRSLLASTNSLWKLNGGEFKTQIDYTFNRLEGSASNITTYFLPDGNRVITENRSGTDYTHSLSAKATYELNKRTTYINNTLRTNLDWDDIRVATIGTLSNSQSASLPDYYAGNSLKVIKRFNGRHLVTFESKNDWELMPHQLSVVTPKDMISQQTRNQAFCTDESAAYAFVFAGLSIGLEGGLKGYMRDFSSDIPELPKDIPGETVNVVNTNYLMLYASPKIEYQLNRVNFTLNAPLSGAYYTFDKALANRDEYYFSPSLSMKWNPTARIDLRLGASTGRSPMSLNMIYPGVLMADYRTFRSGIDQFYTLGSQNLRASINYRNSVTGFFGSATVSQSWDETPYTLAQKFYGDYIVYSYSSASNRGESFVSRGSFGKTIDCIRGSASLNGTYLRRGTHLISQDQNVNNITTLWSVSGKIGGAFSSLLSFDISSDFSANRMSMNAFDADWLRSLKSGMMLNFTPGDKWEWRISGNHYFNEITSDNFKQLLLFDTRLIYKPSSKIELSASLTNILNKKEYNYITFNQLSQFESRRSLRGRELLVSITLRK